MFFQTFSTPSWKGANGSSLSHRKGPSLCLLCCHSRLSSSGQKGLGSDAGLRCNNDTPYWWHYGDIGNWRAGQDWFECNGDSHNQLRLVNKSSKALKTRPNSKIVRNNLGGSLLGYSTSNQMQMSVARTKNEAQPLVSLIWFGGTHVPHLEILLAPVYKTTRKKSILSEDLDQSRPCWNYKTSRSLHTCGPLRVQVSDLGCTLKSQPLRGLRNLTDFSVLSFFLLLGREGWLPSCLHVRGEGTELWILLVSSELTFKYPPGTCGSRMGQHPFTAHQHSCPHPDLKIPREHSSDRASLFSHVVAGWYLSSHIMLTSPHAQIRHCHHYFAWSISMKFTLVSSIRLVVIWFNVLVLGG